MNPQMMLQLSQMLQSRGGSSQPQTGGQITQMGNDPIMPVMPPQQSNQQIASQANGLGAGIGQIGKALASYNNAQNSFGGNTNQTPYQNPYSQNTYQPQINPGQMYYNMPNQNSSVDQNPSAMTGFLGSQFSGSY